MENKNVSTPENVALDIYNTRMREVLSSKLPCDNDEIREAHSDSLEGVSERQFYGRKPLVYPL